jgi:hypothetical protein
MTHPRYERDRFDPPRERTTATMLLARNLILADRIERAEGKIVAEASVVVFPIEAEDKAMEDGQ